VRAPGGTRPHPLGSGPASRRGALSLSTLAATLLALAGALLAPASTLAISSKAKAIRVEVPTPAIGDVTIEAITTTIPSHVAKFPELQLPPLLGSKCGGQLFHTTERSSWKYPG